MTRLVGFLAFAAFLAAAGRAQEESPCPRERVGVEVAREWGFDVGDEAWTAANQCAVRVESGVLVVESTGIDPYVHGPRIEVPGPARLRIRLRSSAPAGGQVFWTTAEDRTWREESSARFDLVGDGEWREQVVAIEVPGILRQLRLDPCSAPGVVEVDSIALETYRLRPVDLDRDSGDWSALESDRLAIRVAPDGSRGRVLRRGRIAALLVPLVRAGGMPLPLTLQETERALVYRCEGATARLAVEGGEIRIAVESEFPVEGPVLSVLGPLEQGLFAGLEYLGKGERSSSNLDIETPEHVRFAPDPLKVTMPLMAVATDEGWVAMTWDDPSLAPCFASPNFFDGTPDHRMSLRGRRIEATIGLGDGGLEEAILWAVKKRGLPQLPEAPRDPEAQRKLCLDALQGPLRGEGGWGHCAEPNWARAPHADHASTIWRLTGEAPDLPALVPGGSHIPNDAIWFVTGRAGEWLEMRRAEAAALLAQEREDGSFRYAGPFARTHFEDTSSGYSAEKAVVLLEFARATGDPAALDGGLRAREFKKRFRTPRGAQVWEVPLHTPDILASAHLVMAYVRGYELTGREEYLHEARRWALSGVPFVYQWGRYPTMAYATVPVYGATNWKAPVWIGLPVQWCGLVYAYALAMLAPHEASLDWRKLAEGILLSAQRMQYPDGPLAGCLPDVFDLPSQGRAGPSINPCALVSLRLALDGDLDSLAVATNGVDRVVAPFPVEVRDGRALVRARVGMRYQILANGKHVLDVVSSGEDVILLEK